MHQRYLYLKELHAEGLLVPIPYTGVFHLPVVHQRQTAPEQGSTKSG